MKLKFTWIFTLFMAFFLQVAFAQEKTVSGVVTDTQGLPVPGVNVTVEGGSGGVQTDFDGKYAITASTGQKLVFSMVGMATQTVTVGASSSISVQLKEDTTILDEVVVVGYGVTTKERYTGTATKVNARNIEAKTVSNVSQALRGEVAGVNVITTNGAPGSDAAIRIRGFGSVNGNQAPLYVVDGAPFSSDISAINPNDIESMTVLKDAAATSIYGSRGANGVILITTKQGKKGQSRISVEARTSINMQMLPRYSTITSPEEYIELSWSSLRMNGLLSGVENPAAWASNHLYEAGTGDAIVGIDPAYNIWNVPGNQLIDRTTGRVAAGVSRRFTPTNWADAAFNTGYRQQVDVQFSGGNEKTRYATSFGYLDDQGYVMNSGYKRYTTRINLEHKPKEWLTISGNMAYTGARYTNSGSEENSAASSANIFALTNTTPAIYDVYLRDTNGNIVQDIFGGNQYDFGNSPYNRRAWNSTNAIGEAVYDVTRQDANTLLGNYNVGINITKELTFETRYSGQYQTFDYVSRGNPYYGSSASTYGSLFKSNSVTTNQNFLQLLRFRDTFGDKHGLEAFVAHESTDWRFKTFSAGASRAILPNSFDLAQYTTPTGRASSFTRGWTLESYFAQLNYDFLQKYYLTASVRRDGSSTFLNDKWGTFGSVGAGWILSKENFIANNFKFVDFLKLKASYGVIGDRGIINETGSGSSDLLYGYQLSSINQTPNGGYSFTESSLRANPDLTWETSKVAQVGLESTWLDNRLDVNVDYYVKNTTNLFFNQQLPPSTGYTSIQYNDGKLRNSGLEFDVQGTIIKAKNPEDLSLSIGVNGEIFKNKLTQMPNNYGTDRRKVWQQNGSYGWAEGHSIYDWYMREWAGVDPATGVGLWNMYYNDRNGNGSFDAGDESINNMTVYMDANPGANVQRTTTDVYSQATNKFVGKSAIPKVRGAFRLNAGYKNFDFTALFGYSIGGYVLDAGYQELLNAGSQIGANNYHTDIRDRWQQPGDVTNVPRLAANFGQDANFNSTSTRFLTKADYFALNNARIGYTVPERFVTRMGVSMINLYVSGDNLMMVSARKGLNPQTMIGTSNSGIYMPMTTFSLGAKVEF